MSAHRCYAALGIVLDVKDDIIKWAYNRQRLCNPRDAPYYLQCLSTLANGRASEDLQFETMKLKSEGEYTTDDIIESYKQLGINPNESDEDLIIGTFRSRLSDSPGQETVLREHLRIIGRSRDSAKISGVARKGHKLQIPSLDMQTDY